uniref:Uncharacterized protein n=1 Tax=Oryza sativa subsp. japonica TaxID=39947 RepID=Q6YTH6_ORYSJ|nr:hypothetical protein [Oryza sativa Japonica Group]
MVRDVVADAVSHEEAGGEFHGDVVLIAEAGGDEVAEDSFPVVRRQALRLLLPQDLVRALRTFSLFSSLVLQCILCPDNKSGQTHDAGASGGIPCPLTMSHFCGVPQPIRRYLSVP